MVCFNVKGDTVGFFGSRHWEGGWLGSKMFVRDQLLWKQVRRGYWAQGKFRPWCGCCQALHAAWGAGLLSGVLLRAEVEKGLSVPADGCCLGEPAPCSQGWPERPGPQQSRCWPHPIFGSKTLLGRGSEWHTSSLTCCLIIFHVIELYTLYTFILVWLLCITGRNSHSHSFSQEHSGPWKQSPRGGVGFRASFIPQPPLPSPGFSWLCRLQRLTGLPPAADLCTHVGQSWKGHPGRLHRACTLLSRPLHWGAACGQTWRTCWPRSWGSGAGSASPGWSLFLEPVDSQEKSRAIEKGGQATKWWHVGFWWMWCMLPDSSNRFS